MKQTLISPNYFSNVITNLTTSVNFSKAMDTSEKSSYLKITSQKREGLMKVVAKESSNKNIDTKYVDNSHTKGSQLSIPTPLIDYQRLDIFNREHKSKKSGSGGKLRGNSRGKVQGSPYARSHLDVEQKRSINMSNIAKASTKQESPNSITQESDHQGEISSMSLDVSSSM